MSCVLYCIYTQYTAIVLLFIVFVSFRSQLVQIQLRNLTFGTRWSCKFLRLGQGSLPVPAFTSSKIINVCPPLLNLGGLLIKGLREDWRDSLDAGIILDLAGGGICPLSQSHEGR